MATTKSRSKSHAKHSSKSHSNGRRSTKSMTSQIKEAGNAAAGKASDATKSMTEKVVSAIPVIGRMFSRNIDVEFESLRDLYVKELKDLYSAENQLLDALPKMAEASSSEGLRKAFESHLDETKGQVERLEKIFDGMGMPAEKSKCKAMEGLIKEGDEWIKENANAGVKDAGLIAAAQRVEHYEMAGYGCVRTYAQLLGETKAVALLQQTLDEEGAADKKLTQLSKRINVQAEGRSGTNGRARTSRSRKGTSSGRRRMAKA